MAGDSSSFLQNNRRHWALLALILFVGAVLRLLVIGRKSLWYDELYSIWSSNLPLGRLVDEVAASGHPPLYYLVAHLWYLTGFGELWVRLLSVGAGLAAIIFTYLLGRDLIGRRAGLWGAAFAAASPFLVWFSREATYYSWLTALSIAFLYFVARSARRGGWANWTGLVILGSATIFTYYFSLILLVAAIPMFWTSWWFKGRDRGRLIAFSICMMLLLAAFAVSRTLGHTAAGWGEPFFPGVRLLVKVLLSGLGASLPVLFAGGTWFARNPDFVVLLGFSLTTLLVAGAALAAGVAVVFALSGAFRRWLLSGSTLALLSATLLFIAGPTALLLFIGRDPSPRFYLWAAPLFMLLLATIIVRLPRRAGTLAGLAVLAALTGLSLWQDTSFGHGDGDWRALMATVGARQNPGDQLLCFPLHQCQVALDFYLPQAPPLTGGIPADRPDAFHFLPPGAAWTGYGTNFFTGRGETPALEGEELAGRLQGDTAGAKRVWLVSRSDIFINEGLSGSSDSLVKALGGGWRGVGSWNFAPLELQLFERS